MALALGPASGIGLFLLAILHEARAQCSEAQCSEGLCFEGHCQEGQCLEAFCGYATAQAGFSTNEMRLPFMRDMYPGVPDCCLLQQSGPPYDMSKGMCGAVTTTTTSAPPCMLPKLPFQIGMKLYQTCVPARNGNNVDCFMPGSRVCSAACATSVVATSDNRHMGMVTKVNGEPWAEDNLADLDEMQVVTAENLAEVQARFVLVQDCSSLMMQAMKNRTATPEVAVSEVSAVSAASEKYCTEVGEQFCGARYENFEEILRAQGRMSMLAASGDCSFGTMLSTSDDSTCQMLDLNPTRVLYFLCGTTQVDGRQLYCGDWVSNPDGQCSAGEDNVANCSLVTGPVRITESECANQAFLQKFVRGSNSNPYCGPLLRGGSCVPAMFYALSQDDDTSLWPLCVRTWARSTCGVDFSVALEGDRVVATHTVEVTLTFDEDPARRLGAEPLCTDGGAKALSLKLRSALNKTSAAAANANADSIVVSDSDCLAADAGASRTVVAEFVLHGDDARARANAVSEAAKSEDFSPNLRAEGVSATVSLTQGSTNHLNTNGAQSPFTTISLLWACSLIPFLFTH